VEVTFTQPGGPVLDADAPATIKHVVHRRYRQFSALYSALKSRFKDVPALPGKQMFAARSTEFLRKRCAGLSAFLQVVMKAAYASESEDLGAFLGVGVSLRQAEGTLLGRFKRRDEPVTSALARGLGEIIYLTKSFCGTCVRIDLAGRGALWRRAAVVRCDRVRVCCLFTFPQTPA
jgi:hypothetical protein